jgi:arylsulfatase A-like enzyme
MAIRTAASGGAPATVPAPVLMIASLRLLAAGCFAGFLVNPSIRAMDRPPNVILIVTDDQGYADVGFHGSHEIVTPHLDALAASGTVCTSGYVTFPVCSPSRAGFLSGRHGARFGYNGNPEYDTAHAHAAGLPLSERTMADALRAAGYRTGLVGKWHLGVEPYFHPNERGFDEFYGFLAGGHRYLDWTVGSHRFPGWTVGKDYAAPILRNHEPVPDAHERYLTDLLSDEAVDFVSRHPDRPFFLYLSYNAPHSPLQAPADYLSRVPHLSGRRQIYAAMITAVDDGVGRLRAKLEELGLTRDTLVVFFSDNGGPLADNASDNSPLRGRKSELWEGGIRVPYVVSWPGQLPAAQRYDRPVSTLDLLPTALAAAGVASVGHAGGEGTNLLPYLAGSRTGEPHDQLHWLHRNGSWAIRAGDWKLVVDRQGREHLFDLSRDLAEQNNLRAEHPGKVDELRQAWASWNASNAARIPWLAADQATLPAVSTGP